MAAAPPPRSSALVCVVRFVFRILSVTLTTWQIVSPGVCCAFRFSVTFGYIHDMAAAPPLRSSALVCCAFFFRLLSVTFTTAVVAARVCVCVRVCVRDPYYVCVCAPYVWRCPMGQRVSVTHMHAHAHTGYIKALHPGGFLDYELRPWRYKYNVSWIQGAPFAPNRQNRPTAQEMTPEMYYAGTAATITAGGGFYDMCHLWHGHINLNTVGAWSFRSVVLV
jgi:hypothetical protein